MRIKEARINDVGLYPFMVLNLPLLLVLDHISSWSVTFMAKGTFNITYIVTCYIRFYCNHQLM